MNIFVCAENTFKFYILHHKRRRLTKISGIIGTGKLFCGTNEISEDHMKERDALNGKHKDKLLNNDMQNKYNGKA